MRGHVWTAAMAIAAGLCGGAVVAEAASCPGWRDPVGKKIVGGAAASAKLWPSQAALRLTSTDGTRVLYICGGTAIAPDRVLTAAHCFDEIEHAPDGHYRATEQNPLVAGWRLDVVLGVDDLDRVMPSNAYAVTDLRLHEDYVPDQASSLGNDIAIMTLARPWNGPVASLALDPASDPRNASGAALTVAGFGLLRGRPEGGDVETHTLGDGTTVSAGSRRLQQVGVPLVATEACAGAWKALSTSSLVGPGQLCAGYEAAADMSQWKDSCGGDSGGAIVHYDARGCPTHVGVVSWGGGSCGKPKAYGVYTRISHYAAWLRQQVPGVVASASVTLATPDLTAAEFVGEATSVIGGQRADARIAVEGGPVVRNGTIYRFNVTSDVSGRLVILDVNADGVVTQLFPNEHVLRDDLSFIRAGQTITVPGPMWGVVFKAGPPFGKGQLIAIVVPPDFPVQALVTAPARAKGFTAEKSAVGYLMNLLQQVRMLVSVRGATAGAGWAITTFEYEVKP